jgi:aspartyl-tRNA(Asn)/glutamyl-tRNA(Gln) amidotransferase subunit A
MIEIPSTTDPCYLTLVDLVLSIRRRQLSARQAVEASLNRIAALDGRYHAFCTVDGETAIREAERVDQRLRSGEDIGPLAGAPVGIKDLICTRGLRTTFGSKLYADHVPEEDDISVARLKAAGAIIIGKTNNSEFGYGAVGHNALFPATLNPWNPRLSPGGSSAGSAVAVATGMVPLALGSDAGGSIRVPASLCGVLGFKPSWGRVPLYPGCRDERMPGASGWEALEHIGPMTRNAADAALAMSVLTGPAAEDRHSLPRDIFEWGDSFRGRTEGLRIAFSADMGFAVVDPETRAIAEAAALNLGRWLNCTVIAAHPPIEDPQCHFEALVALDTDRVGMRRLSRERGVCFGAALQSLLNREWTADQFTAAIMARKKLVNQMWRFMKNFDLLITPTTATAAFPAEIDAPLMIDGRPAGAAGCAPLATIANFTGLPAASAPVGLTGDCRPIGLQIIGRHLGDLDVLSLCARLESSLPPWTGPEWRRGDAGSIA